MSNENFTRVNPPHNASEREMLNTFLDYHRATLLQKIEGLSREDLTRPSSSPSTLTLLGLVKHLAYVERSWFQWSFLNQEPSFPWSKEDPDADFRVEPEESVDDIVALYKAEVEKSRQIANAAELDAVSARPGRDHTLRWILVHMIEETARHNGHADFLREAVDGKTGE